MHRFVGFGYFISRRLYMAGLKTTRTTFCYLLGVFLSCSSTVLASVEPPEWQNCPLPEPQHDEEHVYLDDFTSYTLTIIEGPRKWYERFSFETKTDEIENGTLEETESHTSIEDSEWWDLEPCKWRISYFHDDWKRTVTVRRASDNSEVEFHSHHTIETGVDPAGNNRSKVEYSEMRLKDKDTLLLQEDEAYQAHSFPNGGVYHSGVHRQYTYTAAGLLCRVTSVWTEGTPMVDTQTSVEQLRPCGENLGDQTPQDEEIDEQSNETPTPAPLPEPTPSLLPAMNSVDDYLMQ